MFNGNLDKVISYCENIGADYHIGELPNGSRLVYVQDRNSKDEYRSYIRISKHEDNQDFYIRQDGMVGYKSDEWIKNWIDYLTKGAN